MLIQDVFVNARVYFKFRPSAEYSVIAIKGLLSGVCVCVCVCVCMETLTNIPLNKGIE